MDDTRTDHDLWMAKIIEAVRCVRRANQLTSEQLRTLAPSQDADRATAGPPVA